MLDVPTLLGAARGGDGGCITGTAAKMFIIAGPVIVFGVASSIVYGIVLVLFKLI